MADVDLKVFTCQLDPWLMMELAVFGVRKAGHRHFQNVELSHNW